MVERGQGGGGKWGGDKVGKWEVGGGSGEVGGWRWGGREVEVGRWGGGRWVEMGRGGRYLGGVRGGEAGRGELGRVPISQCRSPELQIDMSCNSARMLCRGHVRTCTWTCTCNSVRVVRRTCTWTCVHVTA